LISPRKNGQPTKRPFEQNIRLQHNKRSQNGMFLAHAPVEKLYQIWFYQKNNLVFLELDIIYWICSHISSGPIIYDNFPTGR
jgi:hypothetical protein